MEVKPVTSNGRPLMTAFGAGGFRFGLASGDLRIDGGVLVVADVPAPWAAQNIADIDEASILPILQAKNQIEFLLLGTGATRQALPSTLRAILAEHGIGLELMDTPASCRAYNHLTGEGRHFAAALLPV